MLRTPLDARVSMSQTEAQRKANRRLGWILATVAVVFALGFIAKIVILGP